MNFSTDMKPRRTLRILVFGLALLLGAAQAARAQEGEAAPAPSPPDEKLARILDKAGEGVAK